ncbi:uncharacterized protein LOC108704198 [Xenopus laevis]|uniref:Uncharacterized protein n=2 Tax=Xenopus laevis TaxID=8355 RepID=A0A974DRS2_XENLA|nr:uncharacterized protein LOC108704198 [Xenopus laevis]OCT96742.1 hypothetical protein XELAEV_18008957mg [Xenopus laevis]
MEPDPKKAKLSKVLIRLCDAFTRTEGNIICPLIKAENSVRVLYKLEEYVLHRIVRQAGAEIGLTNPTFLWKSGATYRNMEGNLFVEYFASVSFDENNLKQYQKMLAQKLTAVSKVKHILIDYVRDTEDIIPQPIISETSFKLHKLKLCYEGLTTISEDIDKEPDLNVIADTIKSNFDDLRGQYTKFAVMSENGKGKSFILNLLLLLTADNNEEYKENNANLKLPQDIEENKTVEEIEEDEDLPDVVKDVLKTATYKDQCAKTVIESLCCQLPRHIEENKTVEETEEDEDLPDVSIKQSNSSLLNLVNYFSARSTIDVEPFILAQKKREEKYESTTKCIIHLRYGTVYQMSVNYFTEEELQHQLFDLVTLNGEDAVVFQVKERALDCLKARFQILTDHEIPSDIEESNGKFNSAKDIVLSEDVKQFAGQTELYIGNGRDALKDRLAMQAILRQLTTSQEEDKDKAEEYKKRIAAVKQIIIYLPSKILYGGKEILEMPGTDDSDPMAMDLIKTTLNEVDAVIVVSDLSEIAEKEVKDLLFSSDLAKYWKENPRSYKLILLAYPEKNEFQFGKDDSETIQLLEEQEKKKRKAVLNLNRKMLKMDTDDLKNSIITEYILPLLHTSILAQPTVQGEEYRVFQKNQTFLQYTGINNLITIIDEFVSSRQNVTTEEVKAQLSHFHHEIHSKNITEAARSFLHALNSRENKVKCGKNLNIDRDWIYFDGEIKKMLCDLVETEIHVVLKMNIEHAVINWIRNKNKIQSLGIFSPHFCGRNPVYKMLLYNIFFDGIKEKKVHLFRVMKSRIEVLFKQCKSKILNRYEVFLRSLLRHSHDPFTLQFVQNTMEKKLNDELAWYLETKGGLYSVETMTKCFEESQNESFRKNILVPIYSSNSPLKTVIQNSNVNAGKYEKRISLQHGRSLSLLQQHPATTIQTDKYLINIITCMMDIKQLFLNKLSALHEERLADKRMTPERSSKMWQRLVHHMQLISNLRHHRRHSDVLEDLIHMMSANLDEP